MSSNRIFRGLKTGLAVVGTLSIGTSLAIGYAIRSARAAKQKLPDEFVLDLDLEDIQLVERSATNPLIQNLGRVRKQLELKQVVEALKIAGSDSRVKGLTATIGANEQFMGLAQIQELRNAVADFREKTQGRLPTVAYADAFGAAGAGGTLTYYLATAFDKVYMQPSGLLSISGLASSTPFLRDFFAKWKVRPFFVAREEYKNVANQFTQSNYTREHSEATQALLRGFVGDIVEGVASSRGLPEAEVRKAIDEAPFTCDEAVERRLIDGSAYRDEMAQQVTNKAVQKRVPLAKYIKAEVQSRLKPVESKEVKELFSHQEGGQVVAKAGSQKPVIALIVACGQIVAGKGSATELQQAPEIASSVMCSELVRAAKDPSIKAVVIRLDSPGGSAVASDTIYREVLRLKEGGKPVIVSMGNVAASGGYYISAPATKIVAQPSTVTGSIGVVFGKFNIADALRQYGINPCTIVEGRNADAQFPFSDWNKEQLKQVNHLVDHIYSGFVQKVALGRKMSEEDVRKVAKGRAWTGRDALEHGLLDALGGLQLAISLAKMEAGLPLEEGKVDILDMSKAMSPFKQILQLLQTGGSASMTGGIAQLGAHLGLVPQHQHILESTRMLAEIEAVLLDRHQQSGPQLVSDYVLPR
ncbi:g4192 [Coccomyxa viridis]|uniref:G4192 protein n=1 Tax=Coccomyxa viridis TaxID=1274662 RepID=A0ABP1FR97_9CHLO